MAFKRPVLQNIQEHPLKEIVVGLGLVDGTDPQKTQESIKKLQESVAKMSPLDLNEFVQNIFNKVWITQIFQQSLFSHPIITRFIEAGTSYEAHREYFSTKLLTITDYNIEEKINPYIMTPKQLRTVFSTRFKKKCHLTVELDYARAAFASPTAFSAWKTSVFQSMNDTISIFLFNYISRTVIDSVKNTIDLSSQNTLDDLLQKINTLADNMAFPSMDYNLGYENTGGNDIYIQHKKEDEEKLRVNWTKKSDLVLITTPEVKNAIDAKVGSIKFHNQYFDISKYDVIVLDKDNMIDTENDNKPFILLVDKHAFKGYYRINQITSDFYANNLLTDYFHHFWLVFGEIPWANGVKILFNKALIA